jgi:hypothetical protein
VQSYLAGVPTLVLGGRDQGGHLLKVRVVCVCVCVFWGGGGEGAQRGGAVQPMWELSQVGGHSSELE